MNVFTILPTLLLFANINTFSLPSVEGFLFQQRSTAPFQNYNHLSKHETKIVSSAFVTTTQYHGKMRPSSPLQMASSSSSSSSSPKTKVILQKVIRSVPLPILVEYIRDIFQIPTDLSMPYELYPLNNVNQYQIQNPKEGGSIVKAFHCPLADDSTVFWVEVLGVFVGKKNSSNNNIPQMVMVAIKKVDSSSENPMMGLYDDSERKIIRALERGLDDLAEGRGYYSPEAIQDMQTSEQEEEAVEEEEEDPQPVEEQGELMEMTNEKEIIMETEVSNTRKMPDINFNLDSDSIRKNPYRDTSSSSTIIDADVESSNVDATPKEKEKSNKVQSISEDDNNTNEMSEEERQKELDNIFTNILDPSSIDMNDPKIKEMMQNTENDEEINQILNAMGAGSDVSPEELLQNVLDFGQESDKKEQVGYGFATGAFEKAKELLRQPTMMKATKNTAPSPAQEVQERADGNIADFMKIPEPEINMEKQENGVLDEQEELRRIFAAGERVAEGRIVNTFDVANQNENTLAESNTGKLTDKDIDDLIASDQTIKDAKSVDEELAELEIRIARNPGEGAPAGEVFDIFNPPPKSSSLMDDEDPTMAVNYPGALPGTKNVNNLPKELKEAVQYAKFAADTLSKITQDEYDDDKFYLGTKEIPKKQVFMLEKCVDEAVQAGFLDIHPLDEMAERARLTMLIDELAQQPDEDRFDDIVEGYKDLLLSDRFIKLIKERLTRMANREKVRRENGVEEGSIDDQKDVVEREHLSKLTRVAMLLLKETRAMGAELEASQLQIIRSICQVAMDPKHTTEEEAAVALTDTVRNMRPLLDDSFVAYLKYAIAEEEGRLARRGQLEDLEYNSWLFVLKIVQEGVYAELGKEVSRYIDHIGYVLRMKTNRERKSLLINLVDVMPSMDVRPFVKVVDNIVASLGASANGDFADAAVLGGMTKEILQLSSDLKEILPPERIDRMAKDADEWTAKQRRLIKEKRDETRKRLSAQREQQALIEGRADTRGDIERLP